MVYAGRIRRGREGYLLITLKVQSLFCSPHPSLMVLATDINRRQLHLKTASGRTTSLFVTTGCAGRQCCAAPSPPLLLCCNMAKNWPKPARGATEKEPSHSTTKCLILYWSQDTASWQLQGIKIMNGTPRLWGDGRLGPQLKHALGQTCSTEEGLPWVGMKQ